MTIKPFHPMKSAQGLALKKPLRIRISRFVIIEIFCFLLILLFMYAAVSKLLDYETFTIQLAKSPFISEFAEVIAWTLPVGEILVALALTSKKTRLAGLYGSLFLMSMFSAYIYAMLKYSYYLPCSCGGILSKMDWDDHLIFNIVFVIFSLAGILLLTMKPIKLRIQQNIEPVYT
jgi:hypothetical protein